jgi:hypothetical protein
MVRSILLSLKVRWILAAYPSSRAWSLRPLSTFSCLLPLRERESERVRERAGGGLDEEWNGERGKDDEEEYRGGGMRCGEERVRRVRSDASSCRSFGVMGFGAR